MATYDDPLDPNPDDWFAQNAPDLTTVAPPTTTQQTPTATAASTTTQGGSAQSFVKGQKYTANQIPGISQYDAGAGGSGAVYTDGKHFFDASGTYVGDDPSVFGIGKPTTTDGGIAPPSTTTPPQVSHGGTTGTGTDTFGHPYDTYISDGNAPQAPSAPSPLAPYVAPTWTGGPAPTATPLATYNPEKWTGGPAPIARDLTPFTAPTQSDLENSPGYLSRAALIQKAGERAAAGRGSILNPGTQVALGRNYSDYASAEYDNLLRQGLAINQNNNAGIQTGNENADRAYRENYGQFTDANAMGFQASQANNAATQSGNENAYKTYLQNYGQFTDAANLGLGARQQNVGERNTAFTQGNTNYGNRYTQYLDANSRTLQDYLTNQTTKRNNATDFWSRLMDLNNTGANAANNSYKFQAFA